MISFGTDGWRAIIAREFTFENIRLVALATAEYLKAKKEENPSVVIGYDTRFLGRQFAEESARVLAWQGVKVFITDQFSTTPQISFHAKNMGVSLGVVITASHNPPLYSGYKLKANFGGPATPEMIAELEKHLAVVTENAPKFEYESIEKYIEDGKVVNFDASEEFFKVLKEKIDLDLIKKSNYKILYDPMFGAGVNTLNQILPEITMIHNEYNPSFGNLERPEPIAEHLEEAMEAVREGGFHIGLATDGDADRLGAIDEDGKFVDSHQIFMILMKYLYEKKNLRGSVVKTVSLTQMVNKYCEAKNIELHETPVGFKYTAKIMSEEDVLIGGEESGGLGTSLHIPERDGLFNGLLLLEAMASEGKTLKELCQDLDNEFGTHRYNRRDVTVTPERKDNIMAKCAERPTKIGKYEVKEINDKDGFKFIFDNAWLLIRASGTEPLLRFYVEAPTSEMVEELLDLALEIA